MDFYNSSEITVHRLHELRQDNAKIQIIDVRDDTETGTRSQAVCKWLKAQGYLHCVNVLGGIDAWAALIDRNIRRY